MATSSPTLILTWSRLAIKTSKRRYWVAEVLRLRLQPYKDEALRIDVNRVYVGYDMKLPLGFCQPQNTQFRRRRSTNSRFPRRVFDPRKSIKLEGRGSRLQTPDFRHRGCAILG